MEDERQTPLLDEKCPPGYGTMTAPPMEDVNSDPETKEAEQNGLSHEDPDSPNFNDDHLLARYRPCLFFHPDDGYWPCSVEWYVAKCRVKVKGKFVERKEKEPLTIAELLTEQLNTEKTSLVPSDEATRGMREQEDDTPCYGCATRLADGKAIVLQYVFFYGFNGKYRCVGGDHFADIEHISVLVDLPQQPGHDPVVRKVYFGAHGSLDGQWVKWESVRKHAFTHPIVYVAKGSHACYPRAAKYYRAWGFANDITAEGGRHWMPAKIITISDATDWIQFKGFYGHPNKCESPAKQRWWKYELEKSTLPFFRFTMLHHVCPCWASVLK